LPDSVGKVRNHLSKEADLFHKIGLSGKNFSPASAGVPGDAGYYGLQDDGVELMSDLTADRLKHQDILARLFSSPDNPPRDNSPR